MSDEDIQKLSELISAELRPIVKRLDTIESRLDKIEGRLRPVVLSLKELNGLDRKIKITDINAALKQWDKE